MPIFVQVLHCFNSRTLGRVRQCPFSVTDLIRLFQFTHPGKGATRPRLRYMQTLGRFNSRTLGRVRLLARLLRLFTRRFNSRTLGRVRREISAGRTLQYNVSIHAPWEGCDLRALVAGDDRTEFQFTHPGKGATGWPRVRCEFEIVSIHAPWEGCDAVGSASRCFATRFQFTHPGKGATCRGVALRPIRACFNSRTLGRVRLDSRRDLLLPTAFQFTHPGKGATSSSRRPPMMCSSFNSRTLGRVRPLHKRSTSTILSFQFTHPGKGATRYILIVVLVAGFNSRTLGRVRQLQVTSSLVGV